MILLFVLTALAYGLMVYFRGKRAVYFANTKTLEKIHGFRQYHVSPVILIVKFVIILLLFLVATESVQLYKSQIMDNTEYVLMLDVSSSMANVDFPPSRLDAAKEIAKSWVQKLPANSYVSVVSYSQGVDVISRFGDPKVSVLDGINSVRINYVNITKNLDFALGSTHTLFTNSSNKTILLFTDSAQEILDSTIAKTQQENIRVLVFGIGTEDLVSETEFYDAKFLNFTSMEILANLTGGRAERVSSITELSQAVTSSTERETKLALNTTFYVLILIALLSILELVVYAKFGGL